ncbi:hypothetical protein IMZ48_24070 [Candidatus Bathyarchaeota archaeon]|nr:hypothetical protein [Candidatus Bathyarchaeota archaeon]
MDIINVVSVTAMAHVNQWVEENDDDIQNALYWRQAVDARNLELSVSCSFGIPPPPKLRIANPSSQSVEPTCKCGQPEHPDKTLVGCSNEACGKWLHDECLIHDALMRTYERLGEDKPHNPAAAVKKDEDAESKNPPLSPTDTGLDETRQTIDVKADESQDKDQAKGSITAADDKTEATAMVAAPTESPAPAETPGRKKKSRVSDAAAAKEKAAKPYLGLFSASLKMDFSPPTIEIVDLREGVGAGEKSWTEALRCILCESLIN